MRKSACGKSASGTTGPLLWSQPRRVDAHFGPWPRKVCRHPGQAQLSFWPKYIATTLWSAAAASSSHLQRHMTEHQKLSLRVGTRPDQRCTVARSARQAGAAPGSPPVLVGAWSPAVPHRGKDEVPWALLLPLLPSHLLLNQLLFLGLLPHLLLRQLLRRRCARLQGSARRLAGGQAYGLGPARQHAALPPLSVVPEQPLPRLCRSWHIRHVCGAVLRGAVLWSAVLVGSKEAAAGQG